MSSRLSSSATRTETSTTLVSPTALPRSDRRAIDRVSLVPRVQVRHARMGMVDPTTCESDYAAAELEFMLAMEKYKKRSGRMFPTWSEFLEVLRSLGYEKPVVSRTT